MRRILILLTALTLLILPSCAASNDFQGGRPITPDDLESISAEVFGSTDEPTDEGENKEINPNTTVYWLKDGSVCHLDPHCSHLEGKPNVKESTLRTAEANGLRLCKDCAGQ